MNIDWEILEGVLAGLISGSVGGAITGAIVAHFLAKRRDVTNRKHASQIATESRKLHFLGFMDGWRTEIERLRIDIVANQFIDKCADFRSEATKIRSDYGPEFWNLAERLSGLGFMDIIKGPNQDDKTPGRSELLTRLDSVVNFVKAN